MNASPLSLYELEVTLVSLRLDAKLSLHASESVVGHGVDGGSVRLVYMLVGASHGPSFDHGTLKVTSVQYAQQTW